MKYMVILTDGMADYNIAELDDKTPLEHAHTPNMDWLAHRALMGQVKTIPDGFSPGSDVANLAVMGYEPQTYYTGRSPLEAISMGVELEDNDLTLRCNLVTLSEEVNYAEKTMLDYSAGEISSPESAQLLAALQNSLGTDNISFFPGISYRNLVVWHNVRNIELELTPPHDISDKVVGKYLPKESDSAVILNLMEKSTTILSQHPINKSRVQAGLNPATSIWLWGEGRRPSLPGFNEKYGLNGSVVAAVDLVKGLGIAAGLKPITVAGATGSIETNFRGKAEAAIEELLNGQDFVYLHIESPDEAGHQGSVEKKLWAIEQIDREVVGMVRNKLSELGDLRIMVLPDHPTPISIKTHSSDPVPFMIYDSTDEKKSEYTFSEKNAAQGMFFASGRELMDFFIKGK